VSGVAIAVGRLVGTHSKCDFTRTFYYEMRALLLLTCKASAYTPIQQREREREIILHKIHKTDHLTIPSFQRYWLGDEVNELEKWNLQPRDRERSKGRDEDYSETRISERYDDDTFV